MNSFLAGIGLVALGLGAAKRKRFRFDREIDTETTTQRGSRKRPAPKAGGKMPKLGGKKLKGTDHRHTFIIGGVEINTKKTLRDPANPNQHTHILEPTVVIDSIRGTRKRLRLKLATTFDPFSPGHTHKVVVRGTVHRSGGPFR